MPPMNDTAIDIPGGMPPGSSITNVNRASKLMDERPRAAAAG